LKLAAIELRSALPACIQLWHTEFLRNGSGVALCAPSLARPRQSDRDRRIASRLEPRSAGRL